ncbi:MAG: hypothetical protein JSR86_02955 [Proteobacteria bacterium]|nr:hypothetical protein [Pseudomonadota bacterium]
MGDWTVRNRRLKARWSGAPAWEAFEGRSRCEPRLGGLSNIEQIDFPDRGFSGMTVRLFDPAARRWSIYWISSRDGVLQPPVCGGFDGEAGVFFGEDLDDGRFVLVRFDWLKRGPEGGPRWSQAFSLDGQAWETNWVMDFVRA